MNKLSLKSGFAALSVFAACMFIACIQPVDYERFKNDPDVIDIVEKNRVGLIDQTEDKHLIAGNGEIRGLKANKYYMIEELDENDASLGVKFIGINGSRWDNLTDIQKTPATGGTIPGLNNDHTYKVSTAAEITTGTFNYEDAASPPALPPSAPLDSSTTANNNGITLTAPPENTYYLDLTPILTPPNTWQAVMAPLPTGTISSVTVPASNIIALREAGTTTEYIFAEYASGIPIALKILKITIAENVPATLAVIITAVYSEDKSPEISWTSGPYTPTGTITFTVDNAQDYEPVFTWEVDGITDSEDSDTFVFDLSSFAYNYTGTYFIVIKATTNPDGIEVNKIIMIEIN